MIRNEPQQIEPGDTPDVDKAKSFTKELESLLNRYSKENESNTPDFILAEYIESCLESWAYATKAREQWYGKEMKPGA